MEIWQNSARNVVIFGVDNSLSFHTDNQKNNFIVSCKEPAFGIKCNHGAAEIK